MPSTFNIFQEGKQEIIRINNKATLETINNKLGIVNFQYPVESDLDVTLRIEASDGEIEHAGEVIRKGEKSVDIMWNISPLSPEDVKIFMINPETDNKYFYVWD